MYKKFKRVINFTPNDELFIIGDIFDRNKKHPEQCLYILDDIIKNDNIHLILGNHEYFYLNYFEYNSIPKIKIDFHISKLDYDLSLLNYLKNLPKNKLQKYIDYLKSCPYEYSFIKNNQFFYLCHAIPARKKINKNNYIKKITNGTFSIQKLYSYTKDIYYSTNYKYNLDKQLNIICGHIPTNYILHKSVFSPLIYSGTISFKHKKIAISNYLIDCGCSGQKFYNNILGYICYDPVNNIFIKNTIQC